MRVNLANRVHNIHLPRTHPLSPLFEAVVNSFQSIEDAGSRSESFIRITAERATTLSFEEGADTGAIRSFTIEDNGIGFTNENYESFRTSDTDYKATRGGKGVGRFLWLKAFNRVDIDSTFLEDSKWKRRSLVFTRYSQLAEDHLLPVMNEEGLTRVRLMDYFDDYAVNVPKNLDIVAQRLVEHCILILMSPNCPAMSLNDGQSHFDLNDYFRRYSADRSRERSFTVRDQQFTVTGLRLYDAKRDNSLVFAAHAREVQKEGLHRRIPSLRAVLTDEGGDFVYLAYVQGPYLDANVNSERCGFAFPNEQAEDGSLNLIVTLDEISAKAAEEVREDLAGHIERINTDKERRLDEYVTDIAPRYRPLLKDRTELLDRITPGLSNRDLDAELNHILNEKTAKVRRSAEDILAEQPAGMSPEEYMKQLGRVIEQTNELGKSALAEYVAYRKVVLDFLGKALERDEETGHYSLEDVIHNLVFPQRSTSEDVMFDDHNLWIVDERLAFHVYLTSDKPLRSTTVLSSDSLLRPDILVFDRAMAFNEGERPVGAFTVIEFKRPVRDDYKGKDPINQVYDLIAELRTNHFKDPHGREVKLDQGNVPAYAYVVCDVTATMERACRNMALMRTPDGQGYFGYNPELAAYIEVISYDKLLHDAQKRNRVLFEKLNIANIRLEE